MFLAEIGDKTQLLTLFLAARFPDKKVALLAGILLSTLVNHLISAYLGVVVGDLFSNAILSYIVGVSFVLVGLWLLLPDKESAGDSKWLAFGAFGATLALFTLAEIGDKTQIATMLLAAQYESFVVVAIASTLGLFAANAPIVFFGSGLVARLPLKYIRLAACLVFCVLGVIVMVS